MSVSGVGGGSSYSSFSATKTAAQKAQDAIDAFMKIATEPAVQRMQDAWLKSHGLTKEKLAAMTPEQRDAIAKEMAADIARQTKEAAAKKSDKKIDITV